MSAAAGRDATVTAWRMTGDGAVAETVHRVHVAVVTADGELFAAAGDPEMRTPARSCLKPIQAQALFLSGAIERFAVSPQELALACASHEGAPLHTDQVRAWLQRMGLDETDLECGAHAPGDAEGLAALAGAAPTAIHNNCSGKHSGMLASALALGAPTQGYIRAAHPVQALIRDALAQLMPGIAPQYAVDGCSLPTPIITVRELALAFARLAAGVPGSPGLPGLGPTFEAMCAHPELVGGRGVLDTLLMRSLTGMVAKRGADGGYAIAVRAQGRRPALGIALKVESGSGEARQPAVIAVLEALGLIQPASRYALKSAGRPPRMNHRGLLVGHWEAAIDLGLSRSA